MLLLGQYLSVTQLAENRDPGLIRLFVGHIDGGKWNCIVVGQNGREVALKTIHPAPLHGEIRRRRHQARAAFTVATIQRFAQSIQVSGIPSQ
jgi:hypothetical protein